MIQEYENIMRQIILSILGNDDSVDFGITDDRLNKWKEKREIERKKYSGVLTENRLIYYSDFYDLKTIIDKNWNLFKQILEDKKNFEVTFKKIETFRNTKSHGRPLFTHQNKLIEGILGEAKALLVKYHNKNADMNDYFIRILRISDSLGNSWTPNHPNISGMTTKSHVRVDDRINIIIEAFDPKSREITYQLKGANLDLSNETGEFELIATKEMISRRYSLSAIVFTNEEEYDNCEQKAIQYIIIPKV